MIVQEVWTLCRILKRNVSYKKCVPDWREVCNNGGAKKIGYPVEASSKACSTVESNDCQSYISFMDPGIGQMNEKKPFPCSRMNEMNNLRGSSQLSSTSVVSEQPPPSASYSYANYFTTGMNEMLLKHGDWDELGSVVGFAADPFIMYANN